ncbi:TrbI/VirB10 family protein [Leeia oryzae]|uniref:TrbI/VirB10 family protein n=1 Tax=Leeia oryzae TaxID=356662 RepID=UPI000368E1C8|nr:TrbI/VirB10 family protein [Leeia oryzae]
MNYQHPHDEAHPAMPELPSEPSIALPDLDKNIPRLDSGMSRRLNKKAMLFLGVIGIIGLTLAVSMFKSIGKKAPKVIEQEAQKQDLVIPERPLPQGVKLPAIPDLEAGTNLPAPSSIAATSGKEQPSIDIENAALPAIPVLPVSHNPGLKQPTALPGRVFAHMPTLTERRLGSGSPVGVTNSNTALSDNLTRTPMSGDTTALFDPAMQPVAQSGNTQRATRLKNADTLLVKGSYIRCVLESKIISDLQGFTACVTTEPVYSVNGKTQLIPRGSKILGQYGGGSDKSYDRLAVIWDRVITPTGLDIHLTSPGIDNLGGAGHPGDYDAHWGARLGAAIMVSMIGDVFNYQAIVHGPKIQKSYVDTSTGKVTVTEEPFDSKTVETLSKIPEKVLAQTINRAPTITIHQGELLNIYTAQDIDFTSVLEE